MTIGEKLHEQREQELSELLEDQGLSLHRQGGKYQIMDSDGLPVTGFLASLAEVVEWMESW